MFNSNEFRYSLGSGVARPTLFDVLFTRVPSIFRPEDIYNLRMRCEETELPGSTIASSTTKYYGPEREHAYGVVYEDITLNFIVSESMKEKEIFDRWREFIIDQDTADPRYYDDYVGGFIVNQYNAVGELVYQVELVDAWPKTIAPLRTAWGARGEYHQLQVTFSYLRHKRLLDARSPEDSRPQTSAAQRIIEQINRVL